MPTSATPPDTLAARLKAATAPDHQALDAQAMACKPFADRARYARFVAAQYLFQRDVQAIYGDARLASRVPGLAGRLRLQAAEADLRDLGETVPQAADPQFAAQDGKLVLQGRQEDALAQAWGWLYVSEGSKLGAAFLFKTACENLQLSETFGARHLAPPPDGRGPEWKRFVDALNDAGLAPDQQALAIEAARAAFARFGALLQRCYA